MSTPTVTRRSAFPATVEALVPSASALIGPGGELPSRNMLMRSFGIGTEKAKAVLAALAADLDTTPDSPAVPAETALPAAEPDPVPARSTEAITPTTSVLPAVAENPGTTTPDVPTLKPRRKVRTWPVLVVGLGAFIAIWAGWVELGRLTGFGIVHPLPGIWDSFKLNTAIVLPLGMDAYAAFALKVWLTPGIPVRARRFARWSAIGSLLVGMAGQVAYHLMAAEGMTTAPWQITTAVSCLPVIVLGLASALLHLVRDGDDD